ncbi:MAG: hypothetical protein DRI34_13120 [Deltaproteobacteria bacterium]|nr:MAG: hypothetical protein DRI34_13120 [Deltaproteobacteria bacterium]
MKDTGYLIIAVVVLAACQPHRAVDLARREARRGDGPERAAATAILDEALALLASGDITGARRRAGRCLEKFPATARAHLLLGDLYELEEDRQLAFIEHMAFRDLHRGRVAAPWQRYLKAKMAGNDLAGPSSRERRGRILSAISRALDLWHSGKRAPAWTLLEELSRENPDFGLAALSAGLVASRQGRPREAAPLLLRAASVNSFLAEFILAGQLVGELPDLPQRLRPLLASAYRHNRADGQRALLLAIIDLRAGRVSSTLELTRQVLSWNSDDIRLLLVGAGAALALGRDDLLAGMLQQLRQFADKLAILFVPGEIPFFGGLAGDSLDNLASEHLAPVLPPPVRQYFLWSLWQARGDRRQDEVSHEFYRLLAREFPGLELQPAECPDKADRKTASLAEFHGKVRRLLEAATPALRRCDCPRRRYRGNPSGRLQFSITIGAAGQVTHAVVEGNTTGDDWLAACQLATLRRLCFPTPLRARETFSMVVTVGPEVEHEDGCR